MRIALIGNGKTGGQIQHLYPADLITVFNTSNPVTVEKLKQNDVAIAFVPGEILEGLLLTIIESKILLVSGATGFQWTDELKNKIKTVNLKWISGSNFSLGMRVVHQMIQKLNFIKNLFEDYQFSIHEIHHTKKLDAPSGTAISWNNWIENSANITHERIGDVVGDHTLTFDSEFETIRLQHVAKDRKIFAQGALWAAKYLYQNHDKLSPGLHLFETITEKLINSKEK